MPYPHPYGGQKKWKATLPNPKTSTASAPAIKKSGVRGRTSTISGQKVHPGTPKEGKGLG